MGDNKFVNDNYSYDKNEYDKYTTNSAHPTLSYTDTLATKKEKTGTENLLNPRLSYTDTLANPNNIYTDNLKEPYDPYSNVKHEDNVVVPEIQKEMEEEKKDYANAAIIFISLMLAIVVFILFFIILK